MRYLVAITGHKIGIFNPSGNKIPLFSHHYIVTYCLFRPVLMRGIHTNSIPVYPVNNGTYNPLKPLAPVNPGQHCPNPLTPTAMVNPGEHCPNKFNSNNFDL